MKKKNNNNNNRDKSFFRKEFLKRIVSPIQRIDLRILKLTFIQFKKLGDLQTEIFVDS